MGRRSDRKRPTLRDVADEAGLSVTQVSRALNGHSDVAGATRDRALKAADRIGYAPNLEARRLKMPQTRSNSIGLILPGTGKRFADPFFGELLSWIVDEAGANGYELQLSTPPGDEDPLDAYRRMIVQQRIDGFIVTRLEVDDRRIRFLLDEGFPFVTFGRQPNAGGFPAVDEHDDSMRPAVELLVELGHRRIGCLGEPGRHAKAHYRLQSFRRAMAGLGLEPAPHHVVEADFREDDGRYQALGLLRGRDRPSAVVAFNDLLAMGALRAADELGIDVPGQLSVVGVDDIMSARLVTPALTTLRQPTETIGRRLVTELLAAVDRLEGRQPGSVDGPGPKPILVDLDLIVRASTGPPSEIPVGGKSASDATTTDLDEESR